MAACATTHIASHIRLSWPGWWNVHMPFAATLGWNLHTYGYVINTHHTYIHAYIQVLTSLWIRLCM